MSLLFSQLFGGMLTVSILMGTFLFFISGWSHPSQYFWWNRQLCHHCQWDHQSLPGAGTQGAAGGPAWRWVTVDFHSARSPLLQGQVTSMFCIHTLPETTEGNTALHKMKQMQYFSELLLCIAALQEWHMLWVSRFSKHIPGWSPFIMNHTMRLVFWEKHAEKCCSKNFSSWDTKGSQTFWSEDSLLVKLENPKDLLFILGYICWYLLIYLTD